MESVVIYCRKSDPNATDDDESFENQEDACRKDAQEKGYSVFKVYREAHSGADLIGRVQLWEAIDDIRRGDASILLVRNFDRLARNPTHQGVIEYEVEDKAGGRVEAALEPVDRKDIMARTTRGILAVVAEAERLNAVARMERGKRRRAERGHLSGSSNPLFGYDWVDDEPGKRTAYVESPDTGPVVRRIFELAKADKTMRGIAMLLNDEGVSTPSQVSATNGHLGRHKVGARWTAETIRRILTDRTYLGEGAAYKWQRTRSTNGRVGHARRAEDDAMRVTLTVPALVDPDTFAVVQRNMASHKPSGRPPIDGEASWLRGHVYCGVCGARMFLRRSSRDGAMVYRCRQSAGSSNDGVDCPGGSFSIRANVLDPIAYEAVEGVVGRLEPLRTALLRSVRGDMTTRWAAMAESYEVQLKRKREELETARRRARQTSDDELAAMFMRDAEELNKAVHQLEQDYAAAREELEKVNAEAAWVDSVLERIKAHKHIPANETNERLSFEDRRHLLDATGLYLAVYPKNWREDGKRVDVRYRWMYDPKDPRVLMSRPSPGWRRYSARCP